MRRQIPSLTGLRFVAAACILLSHSVLTILRFPNPPTWLIVLSQVAAEGMSLFFVLSGFIIYYNYVDHLGRSGGIREFFVARFARLYPLYILCLAYDLLISFSFYKFPAANAAALPYYVTLTQSWLYKPIGDNALIYQFGIMPQVAWSISTEWFFYLVFPLIGLLITTKGLISRRLVAAAIVVVLALTVSTVINANYAAIQQFGVRHFGPVAAIEQDSFFRWLAYFSPYMRVFEFLLGCLCASAYMTLDKTHLPSKVEEYWGAWLTAGALCGIAALHWLMFGVDSAARWHDLVVKLHMNFGFAPFLATLIFCCARYQNGFVRLISARWIILCGNASYSLYLLHVLVINAFRYEVAPITSWRIAVGSFLKLAVVIATSIGLSLVSWKTIELPCRIWLRRALSPKSPMPLAGHAPAE